MGVGGAAENEDRRENRQPTDEQDERRLRTISERGGGREQRQHLTVPLSLLLILLARPSPYLAGPAKKDCMQ